MIYKINVKHKKCYLKILKVSGCTFTKYVYIL